MVPHIHIMKMPIDEVWRIDDDVSKGGSDGAKSTFGRKSSQRAGGFLSRGGDTKKGAGTTGDRGAGTQKHGERLVVMGCSRSSFGAFPSLFFPPRSLVFYSVSKRGRCGGVFEEGYSAGRAGETGTQGQEGKTETSVENDEREGNEEGGGIDQGIGGCTEANGEV